jgi:hypothetical protein
MQASILAQEAYDASYAATGDGRCAMNAARMAVENAVLPRTGVLEQESLVWTFDDDEEVV